jgi:hypothetical protein
MGVRLGCSAESSSRTITAFYETILGHDLDVPI